MSRSPTADAPATATAAAVPAAPVPAAPVPAPSEHRVPHDHDPASDYTAQRIAERQCFVEERTGVRPHHIAHYSFDPATTRGNIENFIGVAQVPLGIAGPLLVKGEHAVGEFLIPLATTEGTLVASYGRGMKVLSLAGGVTVTVSGDHMQRAPAFEFDSARGARAFVDWAQEHLAEIRAAAEATSRVARLRSVEPYLASRFAYLRLDFSTGDAAGQNMVGKATFGACQWIMAHAPDVRRFLLDSYFATDKKVSHVNVLHGRGKRVIAECTVPRALMVELLRVEPEAFRRYSAVTGLSAFMAGSSSNGLHAPNALAAMFIATGQDAANVAEGASSILHAEVDAAGDLYLSLTLPSLIVGTHGGGTGLATQRECLEMLGCWGDGKANKLAEIVGAVALAGELSLAAAILSLEWVSAHERMGRKR
ncbi:MAG: hydroxymethylglutaryl-CoA reductase [Gemmatirosa sp.]